MTPRHPHPSVRSDKSRPPLAACVLLGAVAAALVPGVCRAAGDPGACRGIADPDERLRCYDRAMGAEPTPGEAARPRQHEAEHPGSEAIAPEPAASSPSAGTPAAPAAGTPTRPLPGPEGRASEPAASERAEAASPSPAGESPPGPDQDRPAAPNEPATPGPDASRLVRVTTTSLGRERFHLANGEVWERTEIGSPSAFEADELVEVHETLFGSRYLRTRAGDKPPVKVTRLR